MKEKGDLVLTKGNPFKLMRECDRTVYFDQKGMIVKRFNVKTLPARITQKDKKLFIEEINIWERGYRDAI